MTQQVVRDSGVILTRDSKVPTILHVRYSSKNLVSVTGVIRPTPDGWRVSVNLPTAPVSIGNPQPFPETLNLLSGRAETHSTLEEAIGDLEQRIQDRENEFDEHHRRAYDISNRMGQEVDDFFAKADGAKSDGRNVR